MQLFHLIEDSFHKNKTTHAHAHTPDGNDQKKKKIAKRVEKNPTKIKLGVPWKGRVNKRVNASRTSSLGIIYLFIYWGGMH